MGPVSEIALIVTRDQKPQTGLSNLLYLDPEGRIFPAEIVAASIEGQPGFRISGIPPGRGT